MFFAASILCVHVYTLLQMSKVSLCFEMVHSNELVQAAFD